MVFNVDSALTIWRLGDAVEDAFDQQWEHWLDDAKAWTPFFDGLSANPILDLRTALIGLGIVTTELAKALDRLPVDPSGQSVRVGETSSLQETIGLLALGFSKGGLGNLVVPYTIRTQ